MKEYIYKVTVTDEVLIFDKVEKPVDFNEKAIEQPYGELNGDEIKKCQKIPGCHTVNGD